MNNTKTNPTSGQKIEELKEKLIYGDFTVLGEILGITPDAAKKRFFRGNIQAYEALEKIVNSRQELFEEFKNENND